MYMYDFVIHINELGVINLKLKALTLTSIEKIYIKN